MQTLFEIFSKPISARLSWIGRVDMNKIVRLLVWPFVCLFVLSFVRSFVRSYVSFVHLFYYLFLSQIGMILTESTHGYNILHVYSNVYQIFRLIIFLILYYFAAEKLRRRSTTEKKIRKFNFSLNNNLILFSIIIIFDFPMMNWYVWIIICICLTRWYSVITS